MNFELIFADSFESSWSLLQSLHINFFDIQFLRVPTQIA